MPDHKEHEHKDEHKSDQKDEHKEHEHKAQKANEDIKIKKSTLMLISFIIIALIIGFAAGYFIAPSKGSAGGNSAPAISKDEVANKVIAFLNGNLVQPGTNATLSAIAEENGLYKITTIYQENEIPLYATLDGTMIFLSQPVLTNETIGNSKQTASTDIPKGDKASAELFVMSFCPYGVQAEGIMKPVVDLLGSEANIKIRFIASVGGTTVDSIQSLHGAKEAKEDLRQLCIMKYYPDKYWSYLTTFNENCYPKSSDAAGIDACWKATATNLSMDVAKIETCANGSEGLDLLRVDEAAANAYGVSGSPTLIINGATYSGARSSDAYKQSICSAFTTPPAECNQVVQASGTTNTAAAQGGCAT